MDTRVPVLVDRESYDEFKTHSERSGVPVARLVRDAMKAYLPLAAKSKELGKENRPTTVK